MNRLKNYSLNIFFFTAGIILLPVPLVGDFHFESAAIAATLGAFWAAFSLLKNSEPGDLRKLGRIYINLGIFGLPLLIYAVFKGCFSVHGLWFWLLTPVPAVFLGAAIGRAARLLPFRHKKTAVLLAMFFSGLGVFLIEFKLLPQVYFFNPIWGYFPGPIYDETVHVTKSYLFYRGISLLWIFLIWNLPGAGKRFRKRVTVLVCMVALVFSYVNLANFGIITPRNLLKKELSTHITTSHFDLYFDPEYFTPEEAGYWAAKHEFYFYEIVRLLEIDWPQGRKIESFLYANAWQKKDLVGAKYTSYVPIWLAQDQLHIAKQHLSRVLKHELVHVISKQFGNRLFNGSISIGLIEGLAEAVSGNTSNQSTLQQIVAAESAYPSAKQMRESLSLSGFYKNAASVSYTTTGAFVEYLLVEYPVQYFKDTYPNARFDIYYPVPFDTLVARWEKQLASTQVDSTDKQISEFLFSQLSLFQKKCPHRLTRVSRLWDEYNYYETVKDTAESLDAIRKLFALDADNGLVKREWAQMEMKQSNYDAVIQNIAVEDTLLTLQLIKADALLLSQGYAAASMLLEELKPKLDDSIAASLKYSYRMRSDSLSWIAFANARYKNRLPEMDAAEKLNPTVKLTLVQELLESNSESRLLDYADLLLSETPNLDWFETYLRLADYLSYAGYYEGAENWFSEIKTLPLRLRFKKRVAEAEKWLEFIRTYKAKVMAG